MDIHVDIHVDKGDHEIRPAREPCADSLDDATRSVLKENKHAHKRNQDTGGYRRQVQVIQENYNHWQTFASLLRLVRLLRYGM